MTDKDRSVYNWAAGIMTFVGAFCSFSAGVVLTDGTAPSNLLAFWLAILAFWVFRDVHKDNVYKINEKGSKP